MQPLLWMCLCLWMVLANIPTATAICEATRKIPQTPGCKFSGFRRISIEIELNRWRMQEIRTRSKLTQILVVENIDGGLSLISASSLRSTLFADVSSFTWCLYHWINGVPSHLTQRVYSSSFIVMIHSTIIMTLLGPIFIASCNVTLPNSYTTIYCKRLNLQISS